MAGEETPWLTGDVVLGVIGESLADGVSDPGSLNEVADGVRDYVEDRRPDLFVTADDVATFTPGQAVIVGAALLAWRCYVNRTNPETRIELDEDVRAMLRIGRHRGLRFGGAAALVTSEA